MVECITVYPKNSIEYKLLNNALDEIQKFCLKEKIPLKLEIKEVYFDVGLCWMWTTIIASSTRYGSMFSYQLLNPRDQESIIVGNYEMGIENIKRKLKNRYSHLIERK